MTAIDALLRSWIDERDRYVRAAETCRVAHASNLFAFWHRKAFDLTERIAQLDDACSQMRRAA